MDVMCCCALARRPFTSMSPSTSALIPLARSNTSSSPTPPACSSKSGSWLWAMVRKCSSRPTIVAFRCPTMTSINASPSTILPVWASSLRAKDKIERKLTRAAVVPGKGATHTRLMPRLTQSSGSLPPFLIRLTMSPMASASAMTLPTTGTKPATCCSRSRVTAPPLMSCSQASMAETSRPTSSI